MKNNPPTTMKLLAQIEISRRLDGSSPVLDLPVVDLLKSYTYQLKRWTSNQIPLEYIQVCAAGTLVPILHVSCRAEVGVTYEDSPGVGQLTVNFLESQLADPVEEAWAQMQKSETAEYSRLIDRGLRAAVISESRLHIKENACWKLSVDIASYSTVHQVVDLSYIAVLKLLRQFSLPVLKDEQTAECNRPGYIVDTECLATTVHMTQNHARLYTNLLRVEAKSVNCAILVVNDSSGIIHTLQKTGSISQPAEVILAAVALGISENKSRLRTIHD